MARPLEIHAAENQLIRAVAKQGPRRARRQPEGGVQRDITNQSLHSEDTMRHVDFSPLYRSTVGFDRLFSLLDTLGQPDAAQSYPPYNIEKTGENAYRITMAVAGFSEDEIQIEVHRNALSVKAEKTEETAEEGTETLYRGIASRAFERRFQLADHMEVRGAALKNGLLHIDLKREVPEELKPRKITIAASNDKKAKQIEAKAA
jgi:molecular chaperone IbpA